MSEGLLTILKFCFLALLYLFLLRVVRVVVLEVRADRMAAAPPPAPEPVVAPEPKRRREGPMLRIVAPPARDGEAFPLDNEVTVGRAPGCEVVLGDDTFVSQVHARVFRSNRDVYVEDLGSTNGTFVNGNRIVEATRLRRNDRVQFGQTVAQVVR